MTRFKQNALEVTAANQVQLAARYAAVQQQQAALIADIERMANPPPAQPSVVYIEPEEEMGALSLNRSDGDNRRALFSLLSGAAQRDAAIAP